MNDSGQGDYGFEFKLDDFQLESIAHINEGKSVVVCAPTGAGKTVIAEYAIMKALEENKRLFYTTPLKALSNQKFHDFQEAYGVDKVGLLTGDISINRDAEIVVMTTEVFRNMLYGTTLGKVEESLKNVNYVVLDEVHYMNDEQRGTVWEESIIYCPSYIKIVALSATIANAKELTGWINEVHGQTELVNSDFRPVPLRHFYFSASYDKDVLPLFSSENKLNPRIRPEKKHLRYIKRNNNQRAEKNHVKLIKILNDKDMLPAIYFAFSRKRCNSYTEDCTKLNLLNKFEEKRLTQIIDEYIIENPYLAKSKQLEYLYHGVAAHHAGLLPGWKGLIEKLFQQGLIKAVFATETLAAGINMPARTTIISSISKRSDEGHRVLTPSEFLQMSGRAGRRGMDEVGYVITIGDPYHPPEEIAELASAVANPLESKFTPGYSMVMNLLQRFSVDEARELILKSFGYYASVERLKPLHSELERIENIIEDISGFKCPYSLTTQDLKEYNRIKNMYVQYRKTTKALKKQARQPNAPEVMEYEKQTKQLENQMKQSKCGICKSYKKHIRDLEILPRFEKKNKRLKKTIEYERDIYWRQFLNLMEVAEITEHLEDNYPTEKGFMTAAARTENEIFFIELIKKGILNDLSYAELAAVLCAVITEESRANFYQKYKISKPVRKALYDGQDLMRKIWRIQQDCDVNMPINLCPDYSAFIEQWALGVEWEELLQNTEVGEGDLVRIFKRTMDLLRQLAIINGVDEELAKTARMAVDCINRDPVCDAL